MIRKILVPAQRGVPAGRRGIPSGLVGPFAPLPINAGPQWSPQPVIEPMPIVLQTDGAAFEGRAVPATIAPIEKLRNYESCGIFVDKIVVSDATSDTEILLRWRNEPITNGFVNIRAIMAPRNAFIERQEFLPAISFSKPIYLDPGDFIDVSIRKPTASNATIRVYAVGRQALPQTERWLPFLCSFLPPSVDGSTDLPFDFVTSPYDLGNPFDRPLLVERFIARMLGGAGQDDPNRVWSAFNLRLSDDRDNYWISQPTPIPAVVDVTDYSWIVNTEIPPRAYFKLNVEGVASWPALIYGDLARAAVGMVGYRQIAVVG